MAAVHGARRRRLREIRSTRSPEEFTELARRFRARPNVIAVGDSWFAYPPRGIVFGEPSNVVAHLRERRRMNLLQLASNGDEALAMLSGSRKFELLDLLGRHRFDFLLFSGGGNDVVGRYDFEFFLRDGGGSGDWREYVHLDRVERRVSAIEAVYRDLVDYCDAWSRNPDLRVVTHTYDYARPDPRGASFLAGLIEIDEGRSWLWPYLRAHEVPETHDEPIVRHLIDAFAEALLAIEADHPDRFCVADTRGTLPPGDDAFWENEIHPSPDGFARIADAVFARMNDEL